MSRVAAALAWGGNDSASSADATVLLRAGRDLAIVRRERLGTTTWMSSTMTGSA